ncbi:membrane protein [Philodulcilactobacillus myokoensis]|uniref:Membrane protein n=1 Tax=Philodulcilactobacillus myokoensis TaxID=2929573 RepID=A0A9W6EUM5_9LACO|nr:hypothetical protein [Philodulcilactobacillus myokoensis]GLB47484.1 membrane protein [Philodulcilactobacillus myokoensis]
MSVRLIALLLGLIINAIGNALTIVSSSGASIYTAAPINLDHVFPISIGIIIFIIGIINIIINMILLRKIDLWRVFSQIIYMMFFSYIINFFVALITKLGVKNWGYFPQILVSLLGVTLVFVAVSIYQRANIMMHPNDDTTNILRFKYFHGSAIWSQFADSVPPLLIVIICGFIVGKVYSINIGTIYSIFCNGLIIKLSDKYIWHSLKHNFND